MDRIDIRGKLVGTGRPCFIIAEAGVNHNGDPDLAMQLVDAAAQAGADAVKFQTFKADRIVTRSAPKAAYQIETTDSGESQYDMLRRLELSEEMHRTLQEHAARKGLVFMSTPFDEGSSDFLFSLGMEVFKIPSGEITNLPLLAHVAKKGKPMIMSTGMANLGEIETALDCVHKEGNRRQILLHCVSAYPAPPEQVNLRAMQTMASAFGIPVGFSDHTLGIEVSLAAVALGACVIEKHFTVDRDLPGPDHKAALEPHELAALVGGIRKVEHALGHARKGRVQCEEDVASVARRSLVAAKDIAPGTVLSVGSLMLRRPGTGIPPGMLSFVVGRTLKKPLKAGELLRLEDLA